LFLLLKLSYYKFIYCLKNRKAKTLVVLFIKSILVFLVGYFAFFLKEQNINLPEILVYVWIVDLLLKYLFMKISSLDLYSLKIHLQKIKIKNFILFKSVINYNNLFLIVFSVAIGDLSFIVSSLVVALLNSLLIATFKFYSKTYLLLICVLYIIFFTVLNIQWSIVTAVMLAYIILLRFYYTISDNPTTKLQTSSKIDKIYQGLLPTKFNILTSEILLFTRNKRAVAFLVNGFLFCSVVILLLVDEGVENPFFIFNVSLFLTGSFLFSLWQLLIAWDSSYFSFIVTNCSLEEYISSKEKFMNMLIFINFSIAITFIAIFNSSIYLYIISAYLFNVGISKKVLLYFGLYNDGFIYLNENPFFNYKGINNQQFISVILAFMAANIFFITIFYFSASINATLLILSAFSIFGLFCNKLFRKYLVRKFKKRKYKLVNSFSVTF